jgi:hypothetical protein
MRINAARMRREVLVALAAVMGVFPSDLHDRNSIRKIAERFLSGPAGIFDPTGAGIEDRLRSLRSLRSE